MAFPRTLPGLVLSGFILAVAGCQSDDAGGVLKPGDGDLKPPPAEKVKESELIGYCPNVTLREGTAYFNSYAKGGQDDPSKLLYQASIADVTRSCSRSGGMLSITVAVAGKVVPGPGGGAGTVTMPIRIALLEGDKVLYSELHKHQVAVGAAATQFIFTDPNLSIAEPQQANLRIFAGYDEGPPKKKASAEE